MKCFALDENRNLIPGLPHPTTQEGIFPLLISKCSQDLLSLKDHAGTLLFELQELEQKGWTSGKTGIHYPCKLFVTGDMKWLLSVCAHKSAGEWNINRKSEDVNTKGKKYKDEKSLFWW
eukprot:g66095.t1